MSRFRPQAAVLGCAVVLSSLGVVSAAAVARQDGGPAAPRLLSAATSDRNANGRIDSVTVRVRGQASRTTARALAVSGYRVRSSTVRRAGKVSMVSLALFEKKGHDTDARPLVATRSNAGRSARFAPVRPRDTAAPAMIAAQLTAGPAAGARAVRLYFSEPVSFKGARTATSPLSVSGHRVVRLASVRRSLSIVGHLTDAGARRSALVKLAGAKGRPAPRDGAGNGAIATQARVPVPTRGRSPVTPARPTPSPGPAPNPTPGPNPTPTPNPTPVPDPGSGPGGDLAWHTLANPIDPRQQTMLPFGKRSHWLQPWRAYLDTPPAAQMRDAVGINFNVDAQWADQTAALLADSGFTKARLEFSWADMDYDQPDRLKPSAVSSMRTKLAALKAHGIRPLILLNSNHNQPAPTKFFDATVTQPITAGSRTVQVDSATAAQLVPGLSGFNSPDGKAADYIATAVSAGGQVTLSKPVPVAMPAGTLKAATLRFAPFAAPQASSGAANASFERTLGGWLDYVKAVTGEAESTLGSEDFDVEIWNELTFGADFLSADRYYDPVPASMSGRGDVKQEILTHTVAFLRNPANGVAGIGIGDGFASQTPFAAGSTSPQGLTALSKHPYHANVKAYPTDSNLNGVQATDAAGQAEGSKDSFDRWRDAFTPNYRAFFPEYYLSGIQTEFMGRDLSPLTATFDGAAHGRDTKPAGQAKAPEVWVTETNIDPSGGGDFTAADKRHLQAKATLRNLSAFVNKGVTGMYFYAVGDNDFGMVDPAQPDGGETMRSVKRLTSAFAGSGAIAQRRSLTLDEISDDHDHKQFDGDGTAAHPALYNRDVLAFLPFQVSDHTFVAPSYVMTRDMGKLHKPAAARTDVSRYDLPQENYRLKVGGVNGEKLRARATDPLTGDSVPVAIVSRSPGAAVVQVPLTDSPRLLVLQDD